MRLLLVEDEEKVISFVQRGLAAERFAVDVARDGVAGLELAQSYSYDIIAGSPASRDGWNGGLAENSTERSPDSNPGFDGSRRRAR